MQASRMLLLCGLVLLAVSGSAMAAQPPQLLAVDAGAQTIIADLGLKTHGWSAQHIYVATDDNAAARLASRGVAVTPVSPVSGNPWYLVFPERAEDRARIRAAVAVAFEDDNCLLAQLDREQAAQVGRLGGKVAWLPVPPYLKPLPVALDFPKADAPDTFVQRVISQVNPDSLESKIQRLQDFYSRWVYNDSCRSAERYVYDYFRALELDSAELWPITWEGDTWYNPIGLIRGRVHPEKYIVICGHVDSRSFEPTAYAPGAEDDASGLALVMEAARVLKRERPELSIYFLGEPGEEVGFIGAYYFAYRLRQQNADVLAVLNFDMIAYPGGEFGVSLHHDTLSQSLAQFQADMVETYTGIDCDVDHNPYNSDQYAFQQLGFRASVGHELGEFDPHWHTPWDTLGNLSMPLLAEIARGTLAAVATMFISPLPAESLRVQDLGTGGALRVTWQPSPSPDVAGYRVFWGLESHQYTDSFQVRIGTSFHINGLPDGVRQYVAVVPVDSAGHRGFAAEERSGVPGSVPLVPQDLVALPEYFAMQLVWLPNQELDLAGYNIYRTTVSGQGYVRLNSLPWHEPGYSDSAQMSDTMYYYRITAIDSLGNESDSTDEVRGKPVTLDHGVLLVDETRNGTGAPGSPTDAQVDEFYRAILHGFPCTEWDVTSQGSPLMGDIGPYSTVVWHGDDAQQLLLFPSRPGLAHYLSQGGRAWLTGWRLIFSLMNQIGPYPYAFEPGQFPYDYLHLSGAAQNTNQDFIGAQGRNGYPDIATDSAKLLPAMRGRLPTIEALDLRDADTILVFDSYVNDPEFEGRPVGLRWLGSPGQVVFTDFPLYFTNETQARALALKVMQDLGEPYALEEQPGLEPGATALIRALPNPFRNQVRIEYYLNVGQPVELAVFDAAGRQVRRLVNGIQPAGRQTALWDARDRTGRRVPAGVYFYRLVAGDYRAVRKIELLH